MDEDLIFNSNYSKLQDELTEAESKLHLARTQRNEAMTRIGELVKELEQCKTPESPEAEAERERKAIIADRLGVPPGGFLGPHVMLALDELDHLRCKLAMAMQAVKNLEIACEQSEDELKALKATTSGGEVYVTGNGQPFTIIKDGVPQPSSNTGQLPPADQVEALARVLQCAYSDTCGGKKQFEDWPAGVKDGFRAEARAAIAHLNTRPEGLPTAEQLKAAHMQYAQDYEAGKNDGSLCASDFALDYLRPWLRDPVGCEMDVTAEEIYDAFHTGPADGWEQAVLDLCRSRIRPVYECKECAKCEAECRQWRNANDELVHRATAARAALEGE